MKLSRLVQDFVQVHIQDDMNMDICGIQTRAQDILPGQLFFAIKGHAADGHDYMDAAFARGAAAVIAEKNPMNLDRVILVENCRKAAAAIAARFYGNPSKDMTLVGITGTNGKTTTTYLLESIFLAAGFNCGVIGTINIRYNGNILDNPITTPDAMVLQQTLFHMKQAGVTHVIMEVSSHGLDQFRVDGCSFSAGVYTNLSQDHLDYHPDMETYFLCKKRFFTEILASADRNQAAPAVINVDDVWGKKLADSLSLRVIRVGCKNKAEIAATDIIDTIQGLSGKIFLQKQAVVFHSALTGLFNLENILCAAGAALGLGVSSSHILQGIEACTGVPGRLEKVETGSNRYMFVDYAHTPGALDSTLHTLKNRAPKRLITVFGCGGDRDRSKRPLMGKIACKHSDVAIVTSDNPRTEDPEQIVSDIMAGITTDDMPLLSVNGLSKDGPPPPPAHGKGIIRQVDRKKALQTAVRISRPGDTIIAAGKGHETYQITNKGTIHFDDKEELKAACKAFSRRFSPIAWNRSDLEAALGCPAILNTLDAGISFAGISTDSRTIQANDIFVALAGDTFDAHDFIPAVVNKGIQAFVVRTGTYHALAEHIWDQVQHKGILVFEAPDTLAALGSLGRFQRLRSGAKVFAITGSNGKTTTRKMARKIFETTYDTLATQKNFNNEIGVPATLLSLSYAHQWAVVEMGMNQPGEMQRLSDIARPDIALVTNTAGAHLEKLKTPDNVARAKAQIFDHAQKNSTAIIYKDDPRFHILKTGAQKNPDIQQILTFGADDSADVYATDIQSCADSTWFTGCIKGESARFHLHSPARFMVHNALAALSAASAAGISMRDMQTGLAAFVPVSGRMDIRCLDNGIQLIDDTYNANPASVTQALKTLSHQAARSDRGQNRQAVAVLGDMLELGEASEIRHYEVGKTAAQLGINRLYLFGPHSSHTCRGAVENGMPGNEVFCGTKQEIASDVLSHVHKGDWVLVKGSRGMAMETIIQQWENQTALCKPEKTKGTHHAV
ncbi:MAG: UDP-N-acetylmuramoyl-L-alanyl-D-glutamate--2,6-diaminopimelate ligase [Desulfobacteraceae bacterium]|nr:UDP-N-acetylmuramoyl-L-alanyl-D-glutamate--2,6-diaminopimelate ligase [Desulfobacteraceae bacterium]